MNAVCMGYTPLLPFLLIPSYLNHAGRMKYTQYYCTAGDASGSSRSLESNLTESTVEQVIATCYIVGFLWSYTWFLAENFSWLGSVIKYTVYRSLAKPRKLED